MVQVDFWRPVLRLEILKLMAIGGRHREKVHHRPPHDHRPPWVPSDHRHHKHQQHHACSPASPTSKDFIGLLAITDIQRLRQL
ncbi:hypothetical protein [Ancylothrix sp. D3o]|uniref:hypothetical protein n=1 Tax=Ancylothrix sp. D3o TaxID=2953691 RepID=UPI0021BB5062|nr:hypothetical protein [Ancylothrix sp. D3o]